MDLFGRKRIRELEAANANLNQRLSQWEKDGLDNMKLITKIRDMDQLVFAMSQCSSWAQMQPIFAKLKDMTDQRMIDESARIRDLLIPEMKKVYLK